MGLESRCPTDNSAEASEGVDVEEEKDGVIEVIMEEVEDSDQEGEGINEHMKKGLEVEAVIEDEDVDLLHTALCLEVGPALKVLLVEDVVEEEDQDLAPDPNKVINIKQNMNGPLRRFLTTKLFFESHASNATLFTSNEHMKRKIDTSYNQCEPIRYQCCVCTFIYLLIQPLSLICLTTDVI